jgi:hypothetical protein
MAELSNSQKRTIRFLVRGMWMGEVLSLTLF